MSRILTQHGDQEEINSSTSSDSSELISIHSHNIISQNSFENLTKNSNNNSSESSESITNDDEIQP